MIPGPADIFDVTLVLTPVRKGHGIEVTLRSDAALPVSAVVEGRDIRSAKTLATDRGIRCVTLDYDRLRGTESTEDAATTNDRLSGLEQGRVHLRNGCCGHGRLRRSSRRSQRRRHT